jgi:hyperosmotically inducible periplasmic protein
MKYYMLKHISILPLIILFFVTGCDNKPDDAAIQESVDERMQANAMYEGVTATVANGVVTLNGECDGENCVTNIENEIRQDKNVDSVINNISQAETETDLTLRTSVQSITSKYGGVQADVDHGVIILRGNISKDQLQPLMNEISTLQPKKIDNQMLVNE